MSAKPVSDLSWAARIIALRLRRKWTQAELARRMRVTEQAVYLWERKQQVPSGPAQVLVELWENEQS